MATPKDLSRSVLHGSAEAADSPCTICHTRDRSEVESTNYCVDCDSNMCGACTRLHASFPTMASHQVVDISRGPGKPAQKLPLPTQRCEEHHGKLLDRYCEDHDVIACETCINMNHRNCIQLKYVPKYAKGISNTYQFEVIKSSTEELLNEMRRRRSLQKNTLQQLDQAEAQSQQMVKDQSDILHMHINDLLKSDSAKITLKYQEKRVAVQKDMSTINDQIDATEKIHKTLQNVSPGKNESELFVYVKQGEKNEKDARQVIDALCQSDMKIPTYNVNSTMEKSLKALPKLGEFDTLVVAKLNNEVNIKSSSDTSECHITGICILPDATLILADSGNNSLKHLDASHKVIGLLGLSTEPSHVCHVNSNEVAVTLINTKKVQFVSVGATMKKTRTFHIGDMCAGICYSNNELFICCGDVEDPSRDYVGVYSLSGTLLHKIQHDPAGQALFTSISTITVSSDDSKLHITDMNKVLTVDRTGNLLSTFIEPDLEIIFGMCTLVNDDLLVCGRGSNNILHISKDGTRRDVLLNEQDGIVNPSGVCYDSIHSRLTVCLSDCNTIKVYDVHVE